MTDIIEVQKAALTVPRWVQYICVVLGHAMPRGYCTSSTLTPPPLHSVTHSSPSILNLHFIYVLELWRLSKHMGILHFYSLFDFILLKQNLLEWLRLTSDLERPSLFAGISGAHFHVWLPLCVLAASLAGVSVKAVDPLLNQCVTLLHSPVKGGWRISKYMLLEMGVVWASLTAGELQYSTWELGCLGV